MEKRKLHTLSFQEVVHAVCKRPRMYVGRYSFELATAFLNGYHFALTTMQPDSHSVEEMWEFSQWIGKRFGTATNIDWSHTLRQMYLEDEQAFQQLIQLYDEFVTEMNH